MAEEDKKQFETEEEISVPLTPPVDQLGQLVSTDRKTPIKRGIPLKENNGMTTESGRFRSS